MHIVTATAPTFRNRVEVTLNSVVCSCVREGDSARPSTKQSHWGFGFGIKDLWDEAQKYTRRGDFSCLVRGTS